MGLSDLFAAIQAWPVAAAVRESGWLFPTIETVHVAALVTVVGTIVIVDLRLLGLASADRPISALSAEVLPFTWGAFLVAFTTGFLMFASSAVTYAANAPFRIKMALLLTAGLNMAGFHFLTHRGAGRWDQTRSPPVPVKLAGAASLLLWIGIIAAGRWVGFTG